MKSIKIKYDTASRLCIVFHHLERTLHFALSNMGMWDDFMSYYTSRKKYYLLARDEIGSYYDSNPINEVHDKYHPSDRFIPGVFRFAKYHFNSVRRLFSSTVSVPTASFLYMSDTLKDVINSMENDNKPSLNSLIELRHRCYLSGRIASEAAANPSIDKLAGRIEHFLPSHYRELCSFHEINLFKV